MAVAQYRDFAHRDILPATWTDAIERFLTARENFIVRRASATSVEVPAGVVGGHDLGPAGLIIGGKPRWIEATQTRVVAGGAGTYDLWVVGAANSFAAGAPEVGEVDNTFYGFELRVVAGGGAAPAGNLAGGQPITLTRKVRTIVWDGAAITGINRLAADGPVDQLLGGLGVKLGAAQDAGIYRSAANALKTDGSLETRGGYLIGAPLAGTPAYQSQQVAAQTVIRNKLLAADANDAFHVLGDGKHEWGPGGGAAVDATLYRSAVAVLKTDGALSVGPITTNAAGGGGQAGTYMGSGGNVGTTRVAAGQVYGASLAADAQYRFTVQHDGALAWGPGGAVAPDTGLFRALAAVLKTNETFQAALNVYARAGAATQAVIGTAGPSGEAGLLLGSAGDVNLYRSLADTLRTDDNLLVGLQVTANAAGTSVQQTLLAISQAGAAEVRLGADGTVGINRVATTKPTVFVFGNGLTLRTFLESTKPNASDVSAGTLIYVSDAVAGSRLQLQHGAAWLGVG